MADPYPSRGNHFAHRLVRLMVRTCAAQEIGCDGVWLVTIVAHTEDVKRYKSPVTFWNEQLMSICGFTIGQLSRARHKAIGAGWLHYEPGGKGKVGRYWSTIPKDLHGLGDGNVECDADVIMSKNEQENVREAIDKRKRNDRQTIDKCATFLPSPSPSPSPSPIFLLSSANAERLEEARNHVAAWTLPPNADTPTHREALAQWQCVRRDKHGSYSSELSWNAEAVKHGSVSADEFFSYLRLSLSKESKNLLTFDYSDRGSKKSTRNGPQQTYVEPVSEL